MIEEKEHKKKYLIVSTAGSLSNAICNSIVEGKSLDEIIKNWNYTYSKILNIIDITEL